MMCHIIEPHECMPSQLMLCRAVKGHSLCFVELKRRDLLCFVELSAGFAMFCRVFKACSILRPHECMPSQLMLCRADQGDSLCFVESSRHTRKWSHDDVPHHEAT